MKLRWTDRARLERLAPIRYLTDRNGSAAERIDKEIDRQIDQLMAFPELGRQGKVRSLRELVITKTKYLVFYRIGEDEIVVLRFFHTAQRRPGWRRR